MVCFQCEYACVDYIFVKILYCMLCNGELFLLYKYVFMDKTGFM